MTLSSLDIVADSPDGATQVVLRYVDEIRFGPKYFTLWLRFGPDTSFVGPGGDTYHGGVIGFSSDGRYLVVERWFSLREPDVAVFAIELVRRQQAELLHVGPGFLRAVADASPTHDLALSIDRFDGNAWSHGTEVVPLPPPTEWRPLEWWQIRA